MKKIWINRVQWLTPGGGVTFMAQPTRERARALKRSMSQPLYSVTKVSIHKASLTDKGTLIHPEVYY